MPQKVKKRRKIQTEDGVRHSRLHIGCFIYVKNSQCKCLDVKNSQCKCLGCFSRSLE